MLIGVAVAIVALLALSGARRALGGSDCPSFPNPRFQVGDAPRSVTSADLDQDGDQDLAVANKGSYTGPARRHPDLHRRKRPEAVYDDDPEPGQLRQRDYQG